MDEKEPTQEQLDEQLLKNAGWKQADGLWVNQHRFTCFNEQGRTQSVPDGVTRTTAEAAKLERLRPKK